MRISPLGHVGPLVSFIGKRMSMILKGLDESFTASIGLMVLRARSLEICSQTHTKDPDAQKRPDFGVAQILSTCSDDSKPYMIWKALDEIF